MKIKTRLILGFSTLPILILFFIGVSGFQVSSVNNMNSELKQQNERNFLIRKLERDIKDEAIKLRNLFILNDKLAIEREIVDIRATAESVSKEIETIQTMQLTAEKQRVINDLKNVNDRYTTYINSVLTLVEQDQAERAESLVQNTGPILHAEIFQEIKTLNDLTEEHTTSLLTSLVNGFKRQLIWEIVLSLLLATVAIVLVYRSVWSTTSRLNKVSRVMTAVASGEAGLQTKLDVESDDEIDDVARSFNMMTHSLQEQSAKEQQLNKENEEQTWIKSNLAEISTSLSGLQELQSFAQTFLSKTVPLLEACQAVFYIKGVDDQTNEPALKLMATYAFKERKHIANSIRLGEGVVGQAAIENTPILLTEVPSDYIKISSGLGESKPLNIFVIPVSFENDVKAVIEIASFHRFNPMQQTFLEELVSNSGIILDSIMGRMRLAQLLQESQAMTEELQAQSEELQSQQDELKAANEELESQTLALRQSEEKLQLQQEELEQTNEELREKAEEMEAQNAKLEAINKEIESARADLEEKARQLTLSSTYKSEFLANMSHELRTPLNSLIILSKLLADDQKGNLTEKQVQFANTIYSSGCDLLEMINDILDMSKIESGKMVVHPSDVSIQELATFVEKSFRPIANDKGIALNVIIEDTVPPSIYSDGQRIQQVLTNLLSNAFKFTNQGEVALNIKSKQGPDNKPRFSFSVTDTGIGIPKDKQDLIFEAFHQADGTTSRKYGGTGLGLTICRQIATLLGGEIIVDSTEGKGSTFTFNVSDYEGTSHNDTFTTKIDEVAVTVEKLDNPLHPINFDLADNKETATSVESDNSIKRVLIVDDDQNQRNSLMELIASRDVILTAVSSAEEAIEELKVSQFDCVVLDLGLSEASGFELLNRMKSSPLHSNVTVFIYTGRDLTSKEEIELKRYAHTIIIKDLHSPQRLLEELDLFLNKPGKSSPVSNKEKYDQMNELLGIEGKKVLLVDDDVRNVFAVTNMLEMYGMDVIFAENGIEGLELLESNESDIDIILMDIMMPEMDGYEAIRRIRAKTQFARLPIIALTAKAMQEDREKCIEVGASDYITKPVNPDQLIALIRVWIHQDGEKKTEITFV